MNKYVIETKQLTKTYGEQTVVNSVNIENRPIEKLVVTASIINIRYSCKSTD